MKRKTKKQLLSILPIVLVALVVGVAVGYFRGHKTTGETRIARQMTGIDISAHTGQVDFREMTKDDIRFVYMKATEGITFVDSLMPHNFETARRETSLPLGFYHFFRFDDDGTQQADFFYQNIKDKFYELMPVLDVEDWTNSKQKTTEERIAAIGDFIQRFEQISGNRVMIYTNKDGYKKYIKGHFDNQPLWICSLKEKDDLDYEHLFWQYKHRGRFRWAEGEVDLNVFNGTPDDFAFMIMLQTSINHNPKVLENAHLNMVCDTAAGLNIYYPQYSRVDLSCGRMPNALDSDVIYCAEAAFTGVEAKLFRHNNIAGDHVENGNYHKGYVCRTNTACFAWYNQESHFSLGNGHDLLPAAAKNKGMGFCQVSIIHKGQAQPLWRQNNNFYRALCMKEGKLCIIDSKEKIPYPAFVDYLQQYGVDEALYLDMGPGWNHSWYRDNRNRLVELFPHVHDYTTNWITFYK